jgi:hypothetical protein
MEHFQEKGKKKIKNKKIKKPNQLKTRPDVCKLNEANQGMKVENRRWLKVLLLFSEQWRVHDRPDRKVNP